MSNQADQSKGSIATVPRDLRIIFVQLLFSLTAAEIARRVADLVLAGYDLRNASTAYSHLLLAAVVVVTSWVGWVRSEASRDLETSGVFSAEFLVLVIDVLLVIFYFILVRGSETPEQLKAEKAASFNETAIIAMIFGGYFVWDVMTKAVVRSKPETRGLCGRLVSPRLWKRGWISLLCMLLGCIGWFFAPPDTNAHTVLLVDATLICLVLLFRALKENRWVIGGLCLVLMAGFGAAAVCCS